jgi:hypothetical protein
MIKSPENSDINLDNDRKVLENIGHKKREQIAPFFYVLINRNYFTISITALKASG